MSGNRRTGGGASGDRVVAVHGRASATATALAYGASGAASVTAQFSLARVTLTSLSGNELGIGLFLGLWLLFAGVGSVLFSLAARNRRGAAHAFPLLLLLLGLLIPASCYWIVLARRLLFGFTFSLSISRSLAVAACGSLPVSVVVGALFGAAVQAGSSENPSMPLGLYLADAAGSFAGGLVASFLLAPLVSTMRIAFAASAAVLAVAAVYTVSAPTAQHPAGTLQSRRVLGGAARAAIAGIALLSCVAASVLFAAPGLFRAADATLAQLRFPGSLVVAQADSRYQSFAAVGSRESLSFYQNGVLAWFSQAGEREEEIAHLALLSRERPGRVVLIGAGWPFLAREILKQPVESLDLIVEDRDVHRAGLRILASEQTGFMSDSRLRIEYGEPARILSKSRQPYDAAFIDVGVPDTLLSARFFTREFLVQLRSALADDGIVVLAAPSVESYLSQGLLSLNASLSATMADVFGATVALPGQYAGNILVAGKGVAPEQFQPARLAMALEHRGIAARWINRHSLATLLDSRRTAELASRLQEALRTAAGALNTLERPVVLLDSLEYREELSGGSLPLALLRGFRLWHVAVGLLALALGIAAIQLLTHRDACLPASASAAGFSGMVAEVALLCSFQLASGNLYESIALLVALFMVGLAVGSAVAFAFTLRKGHDDQGALRPIVLPGVLCFGGLVAVASALVAPRLLSGQREVFMVFVGFAMVCAGLASGASAALLLSPRSRIPYDRPIDSRLARSQQLPGFIYGAELVGGALGGALSSILFLPVIGVTQPLWFAVMGYAFALLLQAARRRGLQSVGT